VIYLSGHYRAALLDLPGCGFLVTPKGANASADLAALPWAVDTGCFAQPESFDLETYLSFLTGCRPAVATCLFATAPDVVGDAAATWARSRDVLPAIRALGYAAALVAQDGIEATAVEWGAFDCLFLGGSTRWKLSHHAREVTAAALSRGVPVHMGRVNSYKRLQTAKMWGCASADGTLLAFGPDANLPRVRWWLDGLAARPVLNFGGASCSD
jgi:hypothetical protein